MSDRATMIFNVEPVEQDPMALRGAPGTTTGWASGSADQF
jgi:hypothetical protein